MIAKANPLRLFYSPYLSLQTLLHSAFNCVFLLRCQFVNLNQRIGRDLFWALAVSFFDFAKKLKKNFDN